MDTVSSRLRKLSIISLLIGIGSISVGAGVFAWGISMAFGRVVGNLPEHVSTAGVWIIALGFFSALISLISGVRPC